MQFKDPTRREVLATAAVLLVACGLENLAQFVGRRVASVRFMRRFAWPGVYAVLLLLPACLLLPAQSSQASPWRQMLTLTMAALVFAELAWACPDIQLAGVWLERNALLLLALAGLTAVYGLNLIAFLRLRHYLGTTQDRVEESPLTFKKPCHEDAHGLRHGEDHQKINCDLQ